MADWSRRNQRSRWEWATLEHLPDKGSSLHCQIVIGPRFTSLSALASAQLLAQLRSFALQGFTTSPDSS